MFWRLFGSKALLRDISRMLSGTVVAQLITFVAMVPLARLYSPDDFGLFAIVQSVVSVGGALAALRYDVAIILPSSNAVAQSLRRLASLSALSTSVVLATVLLGVHGLVARHYNNLGFSLWLIVAAMVVYFTAQIAVAQQWLLRERKFGAIARNRVIAAAASAGFQLVLAVPIGGYQGLLIGLLLGQAVTLFVVQSRVPKLPRLSGRELPQIKEAAWRYRKMPLLNGPNIALDEIRNAAINVLIGNMALAGLGQYSLANRSMAAPVGLINGAVAQVLLQRMSVAERGELYPIVKRLISRVALVATPIFFILYLSSPWLFPFVFGSEWAEAGVLAQALVPWLFVRTFTSPLSNVFLVAERQGALLAFAFVYAAVPIVFLSVTEQALVPAVRGMSLVMAALLVVMLLLALWVAASFDRSGPPVEK